jgi:endonuclease YncB( thermonuclease family)
MAFTVTRVVDGDTFDVNPGWKWDGKEGDRVRIANFDAAEIDEWGGKSATQKLKNLIEGEEVELKKAVNIDRGRVVCDVYYNGTDIKDQLN